MNKKILFSILSLLISVPVITFAQTADVDPQGSSSCVSISNNLRYRTTDAKTSGDVSVLQDFLQANGYLKASPSGYMGLLTVKGVKAFQSDNGISPTGYVGPLTRAKIQTVSCTGTTVNIPTNSTSHDQDGTTLVSGCASGAMFSSTTGASCSITSSGIYTNTTANLSSDSRISISTANLKALDASIMQQISSMRAQSELVYARNQSYSNVCIDAVTEASRLNIEKVSGKKPTCLDNPSSWAISSLLKTDSSKSYCSDFNGYSANGAVTVTNGKFNCGEPIVPQTVNSNNTQTTTSSNNGIVNPSNIVVNSPSLNQNISYELSQNITISWQQYSGDFDHYVVYLYNNVTNVGQALSGDVSKTSTSYILKASDAKKSIESLYGKTAPNNGYFVRVYAIKNDNFDGRTLAQGDSATFSINSESIPHVAVPVTDVVKVVTPNGGELLYSNNPISITWMVNYTPPPSMQLYLLNETGNSVAGKLLKLGINGNNQDVLNPIALTEIATGKYKIKVCDEQRTVFPFTPFCDTSDSYFTITKSDK